MWNEYSRASALAGRSATAAGFEGWDRYVDSSDSRVRHTEMNNQSLFRRMGHNLATYYAVRELIAASNEAYIGQ